jgi:hypothetical protein
MERQGEAAIAIAHYRRSYVQSDLADVIRIVFSMLMLSFYLGLIGPRAIGKGGTKGAVGERVKGIVQPQKRGTNQWALPS